MLYTTTSLHYIGLTQSNVCEKMLNSLSDKCIYEKWYGACIIQSVILQKILLKFNIISNLTKGYLIINENYYCWHTWLYVPRFSLNLDVGAKVSEWALKSNESDELTMRRVIAEPHHLIRIDMDTEEELIVLKQNEELYKKCKTKNSVFDDAEIPGAVKRIFSETCNEHFCQKAFKKL